MSGEYSSEAGKCSSEAGECSAVSEEGAPSTHKYAYMKSYKNMHIYVHTMNLHQNFKINKKIQNQYRIFKYDEKN